jgi:predicted RNA-binding Zn-ribbon protein involved in translation (DUF1610 family)
MVQDNRSNCPVCGISIKERLTQDSRYNCPECGNSFVLKWRKKQRDYVFINTKDLGKGEPLGLPRSSVRAIVILTISVSIWIMFLLGTQVPSYLLNLVLVMVGYYFAYRVVQSPLKGVPSIIEKGTKEPLYMPKGSIRWVVIGGFLISGLVILARGDMWNLDLMEFFSILLGLTVGYGSRKLLTEKMKVETPMQIKNTKSIIVIGISIFLAVIFVFSISSDIPPIMVRGGIAVIGFYFGSRN